VAAVNGNPQVSSTLPARRRYLSKKYLNGSSASVGKNWQRYFRSVKKRRWHIYFDVSNLRRKFGFTPHVSLDKGLKTHYDFYTQTHA